MNQVVPNCLKRGTCGQMHRSINLPNETPKMSCSVVHNQGHFVPYGTFGDI